MVLGFRRQKRSIPFMRTTRRLDGLAPRCKRPANEPGRTRLDVAVRDSETRLNSSEMPDVASQAIIINNNNDHRTSRAESRSGLEFSASCQNSYVCRAIGLRGANKIISVPHEHRHLPGNGNRK